MAANNGAGASGLAVRPVCTRKLTAVMSARDGTRAVRLPRTLVRSGG